jgi:hypothetical protein
MMNRTVARINRLWTTKHTIMKLLCESEAGATKAKIERTFITRVMKPPSTYQNSRSQGTDAARRIWTIVTIAMQFIVPRRLGAIVLR